MPLKNELLQAVQVKLRRYGYRLTRPRVCILEYLVRAGGHPGIREIHAAAGAEHPNMGMATVYRTVDLLVRVGVLRPLVLNGGPVRYEIRRPGDHHHHLVCTGCGQVMEFGSCNFQHIAAEVESVTRFRIREHTLEAYGLCPRCRLQTGTEI